MILATATRRCSVHWRQTGNSLEVPWESLLVPNLLFGLASTIIYTTAFEFISAQSPKSMTGLLIGTFYFVNGFFQLIGTVVAVPFSLGNLWHSVSSAAGNTSVDTSEDFLNLLTDPPAQESYPLYSITCEVWYLAIMVLFGLLGVALYSWRFGSTSTGNAGKLCSRSQTLRKSLPGILSRILGIY